ncbi:porin family protein [Rhodothermus profundi]|uniref:Outer membrane protein beta-barrel domain-containing protein n=1 Tax=Rhodothermus profundi TaxID=633813 RepID=A0A1M6TD31_9BACT|nr:porin family protein [Rhodothermus profundi]SHK54880.1 Outer membrane protein beta-barrel domain-containing protein [Rhodothermus profundi]
MRNRLWMLSLWMAFVGIPSLYAQPAPTVGFAAGWVQATFSGKDLGRAAYRAGFSAGVFLSYPLANWLAIRPEFWYEMKGGKQLAGAPFAPDGASVRITYTSLPLLLQVAPGTGRVRLLLGPQFSVRLNTEVEGEDADMFFQAFDVGGVGGLEVGLPVQRGLMQEVFIAGRYYLGLTKIDHSGPRADDVKNRSFSLTLGVAFR